jgi:hypothetical protein
VSQIALLQCFMLFAALLGATLVGGCSHGRSPAESVRAFCDRVRAGEPFTEVEARYSAFRLQPGGFAPDPKLRLVGTIPAQEVGKVSGILVEPSGSPIGERPVCAVYYGNPFLAGDGKVILAEFKAAWRLRY